MATIGSPAAERASARPTESYIEWGPVLAGALVAAALSFVFLTFLGAIGFSLTSPWPNSGLSGRTVAMLTVFFLVAQQIGSFMAGGYIAGRMRAPHAERGTDETDFRDGLHGGLVWAVGVVIGAGLAFSVAGSATQAATNAIGPAAANLASQTSDALVDSLLRPAGAQQAAPGQPPGPPQNQANVGQPAGSDPRAEIGRLMAASVANGSMSPADRSYLIQLVAQRTGISREDAERRVDEATTKAREAADKARRAARTMALITGIGLMISLAAAWWSAMRGGHHRDNSIPARLNFNTMPRGPRMGT